MPLIRDPLVKIISESERLYSDTVFSGMTCINPESPSKQVSRISADVGAHTNQRVFGAL